MCSFSVPETITILRFLRRNTFYKFKYYLNKPSTISYYVLIKIMKFHKTIAFSVFTYGSETWTTTWIELREILSSK